MEGLQPGPLVLRNADPRLSGTANWNGGLLGYSGTSPLLGKAQLQVSLGNIEGEHNLRFTDIAFLNRFESTGDERWFNQRNISYKVTVIGNAFLNIQGTNHEPGIITGAFLGTNHEYMGGTVKRTDMVGAFGGKR